MSVRTLIKTSQYHDSVSLMLVARQLASRPGVSDAAVVMATEANKAILSGAGLLSSEAGDAGPNDLVIAVSGNEEVLASALLEVEKLLAEKPGSSGQVDFRPKTLRSALKTNPAANMAVVSVAGRYAARQAWEALRSGLHVLLFSDNVSLEDEIALKQYAVQNGLLLMGPGAGTAILNQVALGFANVIPPGPIGIVSAAGTGLQEVSVLIARYGSGITQGIGTGGRDLREEVGGLMMLAGLQALQDDPATQVIVLVSKPPALSVAQKILDQAGRSLKPTIVCFLGEQRALQLKGNVRTAYTLQEAALQASCESGAASQDLRAALEEEETALAAKVALRFANAKIGGPRYLRGLFSGGTLCYEAQVIWQEMLAQPVYSNAPLMREYLLPDSTRSQGHSAVDLGEEEFTVGRPHPMIDQDLRIRRIFQEARDSETAVIVLDVVLGYGAHLDPASELGLAVKQGRNLAAEDGRDLIVVASVTGTPHDPQGWDRQIKTLEEAGVIVCSSNAAAARLAGKLVGDRGL